MIIRSAIIPIGPGHAALFLVNRDQLYPLSAAAFLRQVAHIHPQLGRILITPRVQGFSYTSPMLDLREPINADAVEWVEYDLCAAPVEELPF